MPSDKNTTAKTASYGDLIGRLHDARPDDVIRIIRYPDGTEVIEAFPPWRPETLPSKRPEQKPAVPKFRFEDREEKGGVPDWLQKAAPEAPPRKKGRLAPGKGTGKRT